MPIPRNLRVLDAAWAVRDEIDELLRKRGFAFPDPDQLHRAVGSISDNIAEGFGRGPGRDRSRFLRIARASAEETINHLRRALKWGAIDQKTFWHFQNRIVSITRMLNALM